MPRELRQGGASAPRPTETAALRARLAVAEETLRAIRAGEVDAVVVSGATGPRVFTLEGAGHVYRLLVEAMNEGALTVGADGTILYANECFARMVHRPLERVLGRSLRSFLSAGSRAAVERLLARTGTSGAKLLADLRAVGGAPTPVQISVRALPRNGSTEAVSALVVTDLTETRRNEEVLQRLAGHMVQEHETERESVALELRENVGQLAYAILVRFDAMMRRRPEGAGASPAELASFRELLDREIAEVRRIAHELRPAALRHLGLVPVLRAECARFGDGAGVCVDVTCPAPLERLPVAIEPALYRVLQEALRNVGHRTHVHHVAVRLGRRGGFVTLAIEDDGVVVADDAATERAPARDLRLFGLREHVRSFGGTLTIRAGRRGTTQVAARIPLPSDATAGAS